MRKITIYLRDYVDDSRRRERRRGTIVAIGAVLVALFAAGAFGPAVKEKEAEVTDTTRTTDTTQTVTTQTTDTTQTTITTQTTDTTQTTVTTQTTDTSQTADTTQTTTGSTDTTDTSTTTIAAAPAKLSATPDGFDFNRQRPGTRSDPRPVTVRNDGDDPLSIKVNIEGAGFDWTSNCTAPLARGETCSVAVTFAPQSPGLQTAKLIIDSNGGTAVITLNGFALRIPPSDLGTIDFGPQSVNTHVPPRTVVFTNANALPVALATPTIIPDKSPFGVVGEPCGVVPPGGGCKVSIAFTPRLGESTAELRIFDANQNLVAYARLTGSGYRRLQVNPALIQRPPAKKP
jgi:hypothetical protein